MTSDSRLKGYRVRVTHPTLPLERTYCTTCTKPWGWVSTESSGLISPANIEVICDDCYLLRMTNAGAVPPPAIHVPPSALELYGLVDENDPRVKEFKSNGRIQKSFEEQYAAENKLACPGCQNSDYHLEDDPDNPTGPQVAVCHVCTRLSGLKTGWVLQKRVNRVIGVTNA